MKRTGLSVAVLLAGLSLPVHAEVDGDAVIGGALGGAAGAAVGSAVGGRNGAIVGGAIGGGAGAAIATSGKKTETRAVTVNKEVIVVREGGGRHDNGLHLGQYKNKHKHKYKHGHGD